MSHDGQKVEQNQSRIGWQGQDQQIIGGAAGQGPCNGQQELCTNASQPSLETLLMIAKLLNVEVNDLVRLEAVND